MAKTTEKKYLITIKLQRYNNERFSWTSFLQSIINTKTKVFDDWTASADRAKKMTYAEAVENLLTVRTKYPRAILEILPADMF